MKWFQSKGKRLTEQQNRILSAWMLQTMRVQDCGFRGDRAQFLSKCEEGMREAVARLLEMNQQTRF